jgi:hypothetical protein
MKTPARSLIAALVVLSSAALAQPTPKPQGAPAAEAPAAQASKPAPAKAEKKISISYRGSLRDALKQIASKGGINLVVSGGLDVPAEVYLTDVSPEEALRTVADAYELKVASSGNIWTLRPLTPGEKAAGPSFATPPSPMVTPVPGAPVVPPVPVAPRAAAPAPTPPPNETPEERAERMEAEAERAQEDAERHAEEIERQAEAQQEQAEAIREHEREVRKVERKVRKIERGHGDNDVVIYGGPETVIEAERTVDNAVVYGGRLVVNGHVEGDAVVFGGQLHLGSTAVVEGDVVSLGGSLTREPGAVIEGEQVSLGGPGGLGIGRLVAGMHRGPGDDGDEPEAASENRRHRDGFSFPGFLVWFAALFGIGFFATVLAPNRMKQVENELARDPVKCGATGLLAALAFLPLIVLLSVTIVGIPIAFALLLVAPLAAAVGLAVVASEIGLRLPVFRGKKTQAVVLALGLLLILVVGLIPYVGNVVVAVLVLLGLGAIVRSRFGIKPKGFPEPVIG